MAASISYGERAALRRALLEHAPWLAADDIGPQAVAAGECDGCGVEPRLVQPCSPPPSGTAIGPDWALGRRCALAAGVDGWCAGHQDDARAALRWLATLPDDADDVARLWWVATGEVRTAAALEEASFPGRISIDLPRP